MKLRMNTIVPKIVKIGEELEVLEKIISEVIQILQYMNFMDKRVKEAKRIFKKVKIQLTLKEK